MEIKKKSVSLEELSPILLAMLKENIDVTLTVTGNSMYPLWRHREDTVVLTSCDKESLKKGDVPLYQRNGTGQYVLHRIVSVQKDTYTMCGDAQTQLEKNLPKENVIAVVKTFTYRGKAYECSNPLYRVYSTVWIWIRPFRRIILALYRRMCGAVK